MGEKVLLIIFMLLEHNINQRLNHIGLQIHECYMSLNESVNPRNLESYLEKVKNTGTVSSFVPHPSPDLKTSNRSINFFGLGREKELSL